MANTGMRALWCGILLAAGLPAVAGVITIRSDEWLPYNGGSNLKPPGYMIEMADSIAKKNGHEIEYRVLLWDDSLEAVRKGLTDCVVGAYKSDAEDLVYPKKPWGRSAQNFYGFEELKWQYDGPESLGKVRVGVAADYSYGDLDPYIEANKADPTKIVVVPKLGRVIVRLIAQVVSRRIEVFVEDANVARSGLAQAGISDRIVSKGSVGELNDVYIACTPAGTRGQELVDMFDQGIDQLRSSGELEKILAKYGLKDWQT